MSSFEEMVAGTQFYKRLGSLNLADHGIELEKLRHNSISIHFRNSSRAELAEKDIRDALLQAGVNKENFRINMFTRGRADSCSLLFMFNEPELNKYRMAFETLYQQQMEHPTWFNGPGNAMQLPNEPARAGSFANMLASGASFANSGTCKAQEVAEPLPRRGRLSDDGGVVR